MTGASAIKGVLLLTDGYRGKKQADVNILHTVKQLGVTNVPEHPSDNWTGNSSRADHVLDSEASPRTF